MVAAGQGKLGALRHFLRTNPSDVGETDGMGRELRGKEVVGLPRPRN